MRLRACAALCWLLSATSAMAQPKVIPYSGLTPGLNTKAQVDLTLGEPRRRVVETDQIYEYTPPRGSDDTEKVIVDYWTDTLQIARIDVYPKVPPPADPIRADFGTRVIARGRTDKNYDELFFPMMMGLIVTSPDRDGRAVAITYMSPRSLGWVFARRFDAALAEKRLDDARTEAEKAATVDPDGGEGYLALGRYFHAVSDWTEAVARFTLAVTAKYSARDRMYAHSWLASIYEQHLNAPEKARQELAAALTEAPAALRDQPHEWLGGFHARQNRPDDAISEFTLALASQPSNRLAARGLADVYYTRKQYAEALPHYETLARASDTETIADKETAWFRYAFCLGEAGRRRDAIPWYERLIQTDYRKTAVLNNIGSDYRQLGQAEKALGYLQKGVAIEPKEPLLNSNLAKTLLDLGRYAEACQQAQTALALEPKNGFRMIDVARAYGGLKKKRETLQWINQAVAAGFRDRDALTRDPLLAIVQHDSTFKKLLLTIK